MIQIIAGTFGYYDGRKVIPLTNESGPKQLDPELEARLVKKGIAKYVGVEHAQNADVGAHDEKTDAQAENLPEYNEDMKLEELKNIAAAYGVDAHAMRKKADVIAAIEAAKEEDVEDDEEPPHFDVEAPV